MKQHWTPQELIDHWTLSREEIHFVTTVSQTDYNQFGSGLLFKCFQHEGKFLQRKQDIPFLSSQTAPVSVEQTFSSS